MTSTEPNPLILALDFGGTKIACAVADLAGTPVEEVVIATEADKGAEQAMRRTFAAVDELRSRHAGRLVGVGVSTMGITFEDRIELAPNVEGWSRLRMPEMLRTQYPGVNLRIDNDVKAAAFAEHTWGALQGADPAIYVNLGSGIAATIISGGKVLAGAHGAAGEYGYWLRSPVDSAGSVTAAASVDDRLSVEEFAGGAGVRRRAAAIGVENGFAGLLQRDDAASRAMLDGILADICWHVTNLAILVDAEKIVLGGGYLRTPEPLLSRLRASLDRYVPYPPELEIGRFGSNGGLSGALALAVAAAHETD